MSLLREDVEYDINGVYFGAQKSCKVVGQALNPPPLSLSTTLFSLPERDINGIEKQLEFKSCTAAISIIAYH